MATFLDISLISQIKFIFIGLFAFSMIYAILTKTQIIKNKTIIAWIAVSITFLLIISAPMSKIFEIVLPGFAIMLLFIFVASTAFIFFGGKANETFSMIGQQSTMGVWMLIITLMIFLGATGKVFFDPNTSSDLVQVNKTITTTSGEVIEAGSGDAIATQGEAAFWDTIFHPKVLGMILILLISTFSVLYIGKE